MADRTEKTPARKRRKIPWLLLGEILAAAVMSLAVRGAAMLLPQAWTGSLSGRVLSFGIPAAAGAAVYFLAASLLRLREMETIKGLLRRK